MFSLGLDLAQHYEPGSFLLSILNWFLYMGVEAVNFSYTFPLTSENIDDVWQFLVMLSGKICDLEPVCVHGCFCCSSIGEGL